MTVTLLDCRVEAVAGAGPLHTALRLGHPSLVASVSTTLRDPDTGQVGAVLTRVDTCVDT